MPTVDGNGQLTTVLHCSLSDLPVGTVKVYKTAGHLPYISHWESLIIKHPVFSLPPHRLFEFTKKEWNRLAKQAADDEITTAEANILRVSYLATLHTFGNIKQDFPCLPPLSVVQSTLNRVLALAVWKYCLESQRFRFPAYHISTTNKNADFDNINDYLDTCFDAKENYETRISEIEEESKARAAKAAMEALTREWIAPVSKKILWAWVRHYLPSRYAPDAQGWLATLFLGGGNAIIEFQEEDLQMMEDIIVGECPAGTGVMKAVRTRIDAIWKTWRDHHQTFEIDLADYAVNQGILVNGAPVAAKDPGPEPQQREFNGNKARYLIAQAKWKIAKAAWDSQQAQQAQQTQQTSIADI